MLDFSQGQDAGAFDLIPNGQLAWCHFNLRGVKASNSGGGYLDTELTVAATDPQGRPQPFAGRKLWDMIGDPFNPNNSEGYRNMGMTAIKRILEATRGAGPTNPAGYQLPSYDVLNGALVPVKIKVEKGTGGYDDKNRVAEYLTPNPAATSGQKAYAALLAGTFNQSTPTGPAPTGFGQPAHPAAASPAAGFTGGGTPAAFGQQAQQQPVQQQAGFGQQQQQAQPAQQQGGFGQQQATVPFGGSPAPSAGPGQPSQASPSAQSATATSPSSDAPTWLQQAQQ